MTMLWHVAGFVPSESGNIIVIPGTQNATGVGIYFTEGSPQLRYAGGERNGFRWENPFLVVFALSRDEAVRRGWFRSKNKPDRPRFWHSSGQTATFENVWREEVIDGRFCRVYDVAGKEDNGV